MYYNLCINQLAIVEFNKNNNSNLDLIDGTILEYLQKQITSEFGRKNYQIINNEIYYLLCYDNIIKQLPLINIETKDAIGRRIKKLKNNNIIKQYVDRSKFNKVYYTTTNLFETFFSYLPTLKPTPPYFKTESLPTLKPNHIDNNIIDNKNNNNIYIDNNFLENLEKNENQNTQDNNKTSFMENLINIANETMADTIDIGLKTNLTEKKNPTKDDVLKKLKKCNNLDTILLSNRNFSEIEKIYHKYYDKLKKHNLDFYDIFKDNIRYMCHKCQFTTNNKTNPIIDLSKFKNSNLEKNIEIHINKTKQPALQNTAINTQQPSLLHIANIIGCYMSSGEFFTDFQHQELYKDIENIITEKYKLVNAKFEYIDYIYFFKKIHDHYKEESKNENSSIKNKFCKNLENICKDNQINIKYQKSDFLQKKYIFNKSNVDYNCFVEIFNKPKCFECLLNKDNKFFEVCKKYATFLNKRNIEIHNKNEIERKNNEEFAKFYHSIQREFTNYFTKEQDNFIEECFNNKELKSEVIEKLKTKFIELRVY